MSIERVTPIEVLRDWQELALIERSAVVALRNELADADEDYPRLRALNSVIREIDASITQREANITSAAQDNKSGYTRLQSVLRKQEIAREERAAFVAARDAVQFEADSLGLADLTDEQDQRYRALTREIATVDAEIDARAQEIEVLAALAAVN